MLPKVETARMESQNNMPTVAQPTDGIYGSNGRRDDDDETPSRIAGWEQLHRCRHVRTIALSKDKKRGRGKKGEESEQRGVVSIAQ